MKNMKKTLMLVLSLAMILAMGLTTLAANTTLTIKTTAGHTYKVYQLLKGDVSELNSGSGKIANAELGISANNTAGSAEAVVNALKEKTGGNLGNTAYAYVEGGTVYKSVDGNGENQTVEVEEGYYVVEDTYTSSGTDSLSRYLVAVAGATTVEPKTETPSIDKNIVDPMTDKNTAMDNPGKGKTDTAAIGDVINYEVTGTVPNMEGYTYYYYVLNDTLSEGLTLEENSFVVTVGDQTLVKESNYYVAVTKNDDGTTTFVLSFENMKDYEVGAAISVKYNATVNEDAVIGTDANTNTVYLQYSNNPNNSSRYNEEDKGKPDSTTPTGETPTYTTKTYVTELQLFKVNEEGKFVDALKGAEFTLTGVNLTQVKFTTGESFEVDANGTYWKLKDGTYTTNDPETEGMDKTKYESIDTKYTKKTVVTATEAEGESKNVKATVNSEGKITFTGLDKGTYTLVETKVPTGYNKAADINFTINATQNGSTTTTGGAITWSTASEDVAYNETANAFKVTVENVSGSVLPSTGGIGTTIFYVVGTILVLGAAVLLITKRRMKNA